MAQRLGSNRRAARVALASHELRANSVPPLVVKLVVKRGSLTSHELRANSAPSLVVKLVVKRGSVAPARCIKEGGGQGG